MCTLNVVVGSLTHWQLSTVSAVTSRSILQDSHTQAAETKFRTGGASSVRAPGVCGLAFGGVGGVAAWVWWRIAGQPGLERMSRC